MDRTVTRPTVGDVERAISDRFPAERAESWDRVGLLVGDPSREISAVTLALDPTPSVIAAAADAGSNLLVTHHPAFLEPPSALRPGPGPGGVVFAALDRGIALINAHTNLDRDAAAQRLIPERLGLVALSVLESSVMPLALVTVYVPAAEADYVRQAMTAAGAGRIGDYRECSFATDGTGSFTPAATSAPCAGTPGVPSSSPELRVEMVCPRSRIRGVVKAAAEAHPYEEPLVTVNDVGIARNASALGMLSEVEDGKSLTLEELVSRTEAAYGVSARVWGDADAACRYVATTTGSGGSLVADARSAGADVLVAGEVRYHDALDALESGLAIIELGHDVTEWPLVGLLERTVRGIEGMDPASVHVLSDRPRWRTSTS